MVTASKHVFEAELGPESDLVLFFENHELVNQTHFFRLPELFTTLANQVLPVLCGQPQIRIWSAGCSDGRESYSLAMLAERFRSGLATTGVKPVFRIRASDISRPKIRQARRGVYRVSESERQRLAPYSACYQTDWQGRILVKDQIRRCIDFRTEDIANTQADTLFDVIVCTNVLLYYHEKYRREIVIRLGQRLRPGGFVFWESVGGRFLRTLGFSKIVSGGHFYQKLMPLPDHFDKEKEHGESRL